MYVYMYALHNVPGYLITFDTSVTCYATENAVRIVNSFTSNPHS
jgi:hypothetical protein